MSSYNVEPDRKRVGSRACIDGDVHDFGDPVIVEARNLFFGRVQQAVTFCRKCGAATNHGWEPAGE